MSLRSEPEIYTRMAVTYTSYLSSISEGQGGFAAAVGAKIGHKKKKTFKECRQLALLPTLPLPSSPLPKREEAPDS